LLCTQNIHHEAFSRQRVPEQITLKRITTELRQEVLLRTGFHPFGDDPQPQCLTEGDDGGNDGSIIAVALQIADKTRSILSSLAASA